MYWPMTNLPKVKSKAVNSPPAKATPQPILASPKFLNIKEKTTAKTRIEMITSDRILNGNWEESVSVYCTKKLLMDKKHFTSLYFFLGTISIGLQ